MNIFSSFRTEGVVRAIERASAMNQVAPETAAGGEEEFFRCSDLDKKDNDAFVEWWANRVVILDLNSALAEAGRTAWTCLPSLTGPAPGEVEGVYPTNTQHFLNALHSANLMLQKDTQCFKLIVQADDQVRVCSSASATACVNVCVCVCVCVCVGCACSSWRRMTRQRRGRTRCRKPMNCARAGSCGTAQGRVCGHTWA